MAFNFDLRNGIFLAWIQSKATGKAEVKNLGKNPTKKRQEPLLRKFLYKSHSVTPQ